MSGRDELEIDIKAALDGQYVKNITFIGDLKLFFKTFGSRASPVMIDKWIKNIHWSYYKDMVAL